MSTLPQVGQSIELFGVGCQGCGSFRGQFEVREIEEAGGLARLVVHAREVLCDGVTRRTPFLEMILDWNPELECWQTRCGAGQAIISISGHYQGPRRALA